MFRFGFLSRSRSNRSPSARAAVRPRRQTLHLEELERRDAPALSITNFSAGITTGSFPTDIAAGPSGSNTLWFTQPFPGPDQIGRITTDGAVTEFSAGITKGSQPTGIDLGSDGNLWFTEFGTSKIGRITPTGAVTEFGGLTANSAPNDIVAGPDGNLWFTEFLTGKIGRITTSGIVTEIAPTSNAASGATGITVGPDNNIWFTLKTTSQIGFINPNTLTPQVFSTLPTNSFPSFLTTGSDGNLWVILSTTNSFARVTTGGAVTPFSGGLGSSGNQLGDITSGPDGNLYVTNNTSSGSAVLQFPPSISATVVATPVPNGLAAVPLGITTGPDNNIWFTQEIGNRIGRLNLTGGGSSTTTFTLTVNGNNLLNGNALASTNKPFVLSGSFTPPTATDTFTATVDYGDGTGVQNLPLQGTSFTLTHIYRKSGTFQVVINVTDTTTGTTFTAGGPVIASVGGQPPFVPAFVAAVGVGPNAGPRVDLYDAQGKVTYSFYAFGINFQGGVRVALGDVNGDGVPDIICGAGPGGGPIVRVFDGSNLQIVTEFFAFDPSFTGGVYVAAGRFDTSPGLDIVVGAGAGGGPNVRTLALVNNKIQQVAGPLGNFFAYDPSFRGGVTVAAGYLASPSGFDSLSTGPGLNSLPFVKVFDVTGQVTRSFLAYEAAFHGGVNVAAGDVNNDGVDDLITGAGPNGGPHVKVYDGLTNALLDSFYAFDVNFRGGVTVASAHILSTTRADLLLGAGPGGPPEVLALSGADLVPIFRFLNFDGKYTGGVYVAG